MNVVLNVFLNIGYSAMLNIFVTGNRKTYEAVRVGIKV